MALLTTLGLLDASCPPPSVVMVIRDMLSDQTRICPHLFSSASLLQRLEGYIVISPDSLAARSCDLVLSNEI